MYIVNNNSLTSLSGLESITPASIIDLNIYNNSLLSNCAVASICDYLVVPNGTVEIHDNAIGCNSQEEVEEACFTSVEELSVENKFTISPNPNSGFTNLRFTIYEQGVTIFELFEVSGVRIKTLLNEVKSPGTYEIEINLSDQKTGIYICVLKTRTGIQTKKIIKLN